MKPSSSQLVVLDTTVLVHLARNSPTGRAIEAQYALTSRPERPLLSTVVEGEILALARRWGWGQTKMAHLNALLLELVRVDAGMREIVEAYAELHYEATRSGKPRGQNDLWIAATAQATGATLFTCDTDFAWMHPDLLAVCCIPEVR
jgi:tRNA(fMet)-specific endonuclease VapC